MAEKHIYRIFFYNDNSIYEMYANEVCESEMFGFTEIRKFLFGATTALVIDPSEESLKLEFQDVECTYVPTSAIIRIDEVNHEGIAKIKKSDGKTTVSLFPKPTNIKSHKQD